MAQGKPVLVIDGDAALRGMLAEQLDAQGEFVTAQTSDGAAGLAAALAHRFELILIDAALPDVPGDELRRRLRDAGLRTPVVLMGGAAQSSDWIAKPLKLGALLTLMRAQLRQHAQSGDAEIVIGPYTLHPASRLLRDDERKRRALRLTEKEAALLQYLHGAGGKVVSRDELLARIWGYGAGVSTHTLETHVYRLRRKIEQDPGLSKLLLTENGGYRLAL